MNNLVTTKWLEAHLNDENLCILDATWHLPTAKRDARAEYDHKHIRGARFFDLDKMSDTRQRFPHMLPSAEKFADDVAKLGISNATRVVVYDSYGMFSAARCWWMFKIFGHVNVAVLDGGLKVWLAEKRAVTDSVTGSARPSRFRAEFNPSMVRHLKQIAAGGEQIVDARSPTRFRGEEPEPRPGVRPGHMPGAANLHYAKLVDGSGRMKRAKLLADEFKRARVNLNKPIVTSCGSGVTAAILSLALTEMGVSKHTLYDGSWAEWGASGQRVVTGA